MLTTISVGNSPTGVGVNTSTNLIYVANNNSNNVSVIDRNTNTVIVTVPVGSTPNRVRANP